MTLYWIGMALALTAAPAIMAGRAGWWDDRYGSAVNNIAFGATAAVMAIGFGLMFAGLIVSAV